MLRVFLVEDETIIRETLRDTVPWAQCGYTFVGEAGDGEMALPLIQQTKPDVLITDIRMPFMDGLALSKLNVVGTVVAHKDTVVVKVEGMDLSKAASDTDGIHDHHCDTRLYIKLTAHGYASGDKHGVT